MGIVGICGDASSIISDISHLCLSFLVSGYSLTDFMDVFKESVFGFVDFSLLILCFKFH